MPRQINKRNNSKSSKSRSTSKKSGRGWSYSYQKSKANKLISDLKIAEKKRDAQAEPK